MILKELKGVEGGQGRGDAGRRDRVESWSREASSNSWGQLYKRPPGTCEVLQVQGLSLTVTPTVECGEI